MSLPLTVRDRYRDEEIGSFYARGSWGREGLFDVLESQAATLGTRCSCPTGRQA